MPETLQTRTEHSRSLEDSERLRAIHTLTQLGVFIPVDSAETFHGRIKNPNETREWEVDPTFANGGNDSGNYNINQRPSLYSGAQDIAEEFAVARGRGLIRMEYTNHFRDKVRDYTPEQRADWLNRVRAERQEWWDGLSAEQQAMYDKDSALAIEPGYLDRAVAIHNEGITLQEQLSEEDKKQIWNDMASKYRATTHEITSHDSDAVVLDMDFPYAELSDEDKLKYQKALRALIIPITEGSPVAFESRDEVVPFGAAIKEANKPYIADDEVKDIAQAAGMTEPTALQLTSAYNARQALFSSLPYMADKLVKNSGDIISAQLEIGGEKKDVPFNLEYVERFMREAHIVGIKGQVRSATLNDKNITIVSFFDLEKTMSTNQLEKHRAATWQQLGALANRFDSLPWTDELMKSPELLTLLKNVHVKPEKLVGAAKGIEGYEAIFDADAGNLEGFTLAEHTETVLRNFDENYADHWPVELLAPMRLAILAHDVGKPQAAKEGQKHNQKSYNVVQAADFLEKLAVHNSLKDLVIAMIGDGEELAFQINIAKGGEKAQAEMNEYVQKVLEQAYPEAEPTDAQIEAFGEMCKALQICDGAAYTSMAITRRDAQGRYRNHPSFNASFAQPVGLGKRDIKVRTSAGPTAPYDLTPRR